MYLLNTTRNYIGETLTSTELRKILEDVEAFLGKPFSLVELEMEKDDPNGRIDIWVSYEGMELQKIFIMNGEVIDGITFHERIEEWYPTKRA